MAVKLARTVHQSMVHLVILFCAYKNPSDLVLKFLSAFVITASEKYDNNTVMQKYFMNSLCSDNRICFLSVFSEHDIKIFNILNILNLCSSEDFPVVLTIFRCSEYQIFYS